MPSIWLRADQRNRGHPRQSGRHVPLWLKPRPRCGAPSLTKEIVQPCLIYLRVISLVVQRPFPHPSRLASALLPPLPLPLPLPCSSHATHLFDGAPPFLVFTAFPSFPCAFTACHCLSLCVCSLQFTASCVLAHADSIVCYAIGPDGTLTTVSWCGTRGAEEIFNLF